MQAVLVVEEDKIVRSLVSTIIRSAGYESVESSNWDDAVMIAHSGAIDAIVLDCMGRAGRGMETLKLLRGDARTTAIPVVAMCGLGQYGAELGLWAKAVVVKPFRPAQLLIKLQNAIQARASTSTYAEASSSAIAHTV